MKKILFFAILACMFVSCSSDGSCEIQIDEVSFTPKFEHIKTIDKVSSIFEVIPGKYELAWKSVQEGPQFQHFNVSLKLKLRLKRTVRFTEKFLDKTKNTTLGFMGFDELEFVLLDAGKAARV